MLWHGAGDAGIWRNGWMGHLVHLHHVHVQASTSTENEWEWTWTSTLQTEPHCLSRTDRCHSNQSVSADLLRHSLCCSLLEILKDWRRRLILCEDLYWRASTWESYWQGVIDSLGAEDHPNTFRKHPKTQDSKSSNKATCLYPQKSDVFHLTWTLEHLGTPYCIQHVHTLCSYIMFIHTFSKPCWWFTEHAHLGEALDVAVAPSHTHPIRSCTQRPGLERWLWLRLWLIS